MFKKQISLFFATLIIIGFSITALSENANAGINPMLPACSVLIEKVEIPDTGRDFDFQLTGSVDDNFSLTNGASEVLKYGENGNGVLIENIPEGYTLDIECTEGAENCSNNGGFETCLSITPIEDGNGVTIACDDSATNDTGSCTFTNTLIPSQVPTLSEWGLIAMVGLLGIIGFIVIRKRQLVANK
jgi:hypothetical protein